MDAGNVMRSLSSITRIDPMRLTIKTPREFSFRSTIYSHGWCDLLPFELDAERWRLTYVFTDENGSAATGVIRALGNGVAIDLTSDAIDRKKVLRDVRHILRLDDDLTGFSRSIR